ncbi:polyribonucleotide nucleotidyltransferase, partial [Nannochloropsis gaditana CCMP526]
MLRIGCVTGRKWVREACGLALPRTRRPSVPPGRLKPPFSVSEASDEASVRSFSSSVKRTRKKSPGQVRLKNEPLCRVAAVVDYGNPMQNLVLGTGVLATQCDGAAVGRQGGCLVLGTAVSDRQAPAGAGDDFLPLVVEYREKAHAFGRINRSVNRREGAQSDQEILASRVIDRVIRPLFPEGFIYDTQVVTTV